MVAAGRAGAPAHFITPQVFRDPERTGAGDAFAAGFARCVLPVEAVRFGCAAAALPAPRPGTARAMPALTEIEDILR